MKWRGLGCSGVAWHGVKLGVGWGGCGVVWSGAGSGGVVCRGGGLAWGFPSQNADVNAEFCNAELFQICITQRNQFRYASELNVEITDDSEALLLRMGGSGRLAGRPGSFQ